MEISEFTFKVILLFLPGIISLIVIRFLVSYKEISIAFSAIYSLVLGFLCYLAYGLILRIITLIHIAKIDTEVKFFDTIFSRRNQVPFNEILFVVIIAIVIGAAFSFIFNKGYLYSLAGYLGITSRSSASDVWNDIFMQQAESDWLTVRDHRIDLIYQGWVKYYSDTSDARKELLLMDVIVYNADGAKLYETPSLYISREHNEISLEFANPEKTENA